MSLDRVERVWLRTLDAHLRSAHAHEVAADLSARRRDPVRAAVEWERAAAERSAHAEALRSASSLQPLGFHAGDRMDTELPQPA
jgi:hypothetical protein